MMMIDKDSPIIDNEYYYHITTPNRWGKIKQDGGLVGSRYSNRSSFNTMSKDGDLYMTHISEREIWNGISHMMIFENKFDILGRHNKPFVVLKIKNESFESRGLIVERDDNSFRELLGFFCNKVKMGKERIPLDEITYIGNYVTDGDEYDSEVRWSITYLYQKQFNLTLQIQDVVINSFPLGKVKYEDRYKITMNNLFPSRRSKKKFLHNVDKTKTFDKTGFFNGGKGRSNWC